MFSRPDVLLSRTHLPLSHLYVTIHPIPQFPLYMTMFSSPTRTVLFPLFMLSHVCVQWLTLIRRYSFVYGVRTRHVLSLHLVDY